MTWHVDTAIQPDDTVHVWPDADTIQHQFDEPCPCGPDMETQPSGVVLVSHASLVEREARTTLEGVQAGHQTSLERGAATARRIPEEPCLTG